MNEAQLYPYLVELRPAGRARRDGHYIFDERADWCDSNVSRWDLIVIVKDGDVILAYSFLSEDDAMLFRLRWK